MTLSTSLSKSIQSLTPSHHPPLPSPYPTIHSTLSLPLPLSRPHPPTDIHPNPNLNLNLNPFSPSTNNLLLPPPPLNPPPYPSQSQFPPTLIQTLTVLSTPLTPLIHILTGHPHPEFPLTRLALSLLTSAQLDRLAEYYHQVYPAVPETHLYPCPMRAWLGAPDEEWVGIEEKRGRFAGFIGVFGVDYERVGEREIRVDRSLWDIEMEGEMEGELGRWILEVLEEMRDGDRGGRVDKVRRSEKK
ncbi:hypothetical protein POX_h09639 [Penicillium oxalicum]|uniref:hypothetical protein n=1 Tax=Penicillium oxalicum TaxID=69781 RepID=UPI0020B7BD09|nr:hypothetical protein POX_h09639 [Penicillium oxalicum]KAI2785877.1 hypothetical protein POX_h09639 [Penicillium oxalicum]